MESCGCYRGYCCPLPWSGSMVHSLCHLLTKLHLLLCCIFQCVNKKVPYSIKCICSNLADSRENMSYFPSGNWN